MTIVRFRHLGPPQRARLESRGSVFPSTVHLPFVEPISNGFGMRSDVVPSVIIILLLYYVSKSRIPIVGKARVIYPCTQTRRTDAFLIEETLTSRRPSILSYHSYASV